MGSLSSSRTSGCLGGKLNAASAHPRHQRSPEGRLDHRDRQCAYRQASRAARVTDRVVQGGGVTLTAHLLHFRYGMLGEVGGGRRVQCRHTERLA